MKKEKEAIALTNLPADNLMTKQNVADALQISTRTVHKLTISGELQTTKVGARGIRITREAFDSYLRKSTNNDYQALLSSKISSNASFETKTLQSRTMEPSSAFYSNNWRPFSPSFDDYLSGITSAIQETTKHVTR